MTTAVANRPSASALMAGLRHAKGQAPSAGGKGFLKFAKGDWTMGREKEDVAGQIVVFNTLTLRTGFVCWTAYSTKEMAELKKQGKPAKNERVDEVMALATSGGVDPDSLEDHSPWEWKTQMEIEGRFRDSKTEFKYTASSYGATKAMGLLIDELMERMAGGEEEFIFPVISLDVGGYEHDAYGWVPEPELTIVGWADTDGVMEGDDPSAIEEEADEQPDEQEEEEQAREAAEEPPVRRRRRGA